MQPENKAIRKKQRLIYHFKKRYFNTLKFIFNIPNILIIIKK